MSKLTAGLAQQQASIIWGYFKWDQAVGRRPGSGQDSRDLSLLRKLTPSQQIAVAAKKPQHSNTWPFLNTEPSLAHAHGAVTSGGDSHRPRRPFRGETCTAAQY